MLVSDGSTPTIVGAEPGQRLRQQAAAAADVEDAQPVQGIEALGVARGYTPADYIAAAP